MKAASIPQRENNWLKTPRIHRDPDPEKILMISQFDGGIGVEWTNSGGSIADDAVNYVTSNKSINIVSTNSVYTHVNKTLAADFSTYTHFRYRFKCDDISKLTGLTFWFGTDSGYNHTYYFAFVPKDEPLAWQEIIISKDAFSVSGSPNWGSIVRTKVRVLANANVTVNILMDEIVAIKTEATRASIIYSFDDGYLSQYTEARRVLDAYKQAGVLFMTNYAYGQSGYITPAQMLALQDAGWEIGSHTAHHLHMTTLTAGQIENEIVANLKYFHSIGIRPSSVMAYPFGENNDTVKNVVKKYFSFARSTQTTFLNQSLPMVNRYMLKCIFLDSSITLAQAKALSDSAVANKGILIFACHQLGAVADGLTWGISDFASLVAYNAALDADAGITFNWLAQKYGGC